MNTLQASVTRDAVGLLLAAADDDLRATTILVADKTDTELRHLVAFLARYATSLVNVHGGDVAALRKQLAGVALRLS